MNPLSAPPEPEDLQRMNYQILMDLMRDLKERFSSSSLAGKFSDAQIEIMYSVGHGLFMQGKFEQALNVFKLILVYRPLQPKFLQAYGTVLKRLGRFEDAIPIFAAAVFLDEAVEPALPVHIAECLAALGHVHLSERILQPVVNLTELDAAYGSVRKRVETLLGMLKEAK